MFEEQEGANGVGGGNRDGNGVGGGNEDVSGDGDGDGVGAGTGAGTGVEANEGAESGTGDVGGNGDRKEGEDPWTNTGWEPGLERGQK